MFTKVLIEYANPKDLSDTYTLSFTIRNHSVADTWTKLVDIALKKHAIDDPGRFYQFGAKQHQLDKALADINRTIDIINSHKLLIDRKLTDVLDQDTLNYLHHVFEIYHGLLDQQNNDFWKTATSEVRKALADLNIQVHACEDLARSSSNKPSTYITWYKMPKLFKLEDSQYNLFEDCAKTGTIYLLYCEIGKTFEDLSADNDKYIHDTAFKPFKYFSADFRIKYYNDDPRQIEKKHATMKQYYKTKQEFFNRQALPWGHRYLLPGSIPVADLDTTPPDLIDNLESRQWVKKITLQ